LYVSKNWGADRMKNHPLLFAVIISGSLLGFSCSVLLNKPDLNLREKEARISLVNVLTKTVIVGINRNPDDPGNSVTKSERFELLPAEVRVLTFDVPPGETRKVQVMRTGYPPDDVQLTTGEEVRYQVDRESSYARIRLENYWGTKNFSLTIEPRRPEFSWFVDADYLNPTNAKQTISVSSGGSTYVYLRLDKTRSHEFLFTGPMFGNPDLGISSLNDSVVTIQGGSEMNIPETMFFTESACKVNITGKTSDVSITFGNLSPVIASFAAPDTSFTQSLEMKYLSRLSQEYNLRIVTRSFSPPRDDTVQVNCFPGRNEYNYEHDASKSTAAERIRRS
ncbi:MAG: hypothetical protein AAF975_03115, partial [Spirochaetota bacterium]